jgi:hypothetical protein
MLPEAKDISKFPSYINNPQEIFHLHNLQHGPYHIHLLIVCFCIHMLGKSNSGCVPRDHSQPRPPVPRVSQPNLSGYIPHPRSSLT